MPCKPRAIVKCIHALDDLNPAAVAQHSRCALVPIPPAMFVKISRLILVHSSGELLSSNGLTVSAASVLVHHHVLLPSVLLPRCRRQVPRHARHQSLCVLPLGRRPVGRVAGLLCERMTCLLAGDCGLLLRCRSREARCTDICLNLSCARWRAVAGFG